MRKFSVYLLIYLFFLTYPSAKAQVLAQWHFENPIDSGTNPSTAPTSTSAGITAANATAMGVTNVAVTHPGSNGSSPDDNYYAFSSDGWPTASALDPGKYEEFTISVAQPGCTFSPLGFQIGGQRVDNGADPGFYEVRTSADGFATSLGRSGGFGPVTAIDANFTAGTFTGTDNPTVFGLSTVYTSLAFRVYYYETASTVRTDRVRLLGRISCPPPMPVSLTSFEGKPAGSRTLLRWETAWEHGAERFEVERSQNAAEFVSIGQVKATGEAETTHVYGFMDEQALAGVNYYRLRQVDSDGSVHYSKLIAVNTNPETPAILVLGNPTEDRRIHLQLVNVDRTTLQLTDMQGRLVAFRVTESAGGRVTLEPVSSLGSGLCLIKAANVPAIKLLVR